MRYVAPSPRSDPARFDAARAELRSWSVTFLVWLCGVLDLAASKRHPRWVENLIAKAKRHARAELRSAARDLRMLLLAYAVARLPRHARVKAGPRRAPIPYGCRRACYAGPPVRRIVGSTLAGLTQGTLRERAEHLRDLLHNPEPMIARILFRLLRLLGAEKLARLVLVFTPAAHIGAAPSHALAAADTS